MRATLAILAVLILAGMAYLTLGSDDAGIAPPSNDEQTDAEADRPNVKAAAAERDRFVSAQPEVSDAVEVTQPDSTLVPTTDPEQQTTVVVSVRDITTKTPIAPFRWSFRQTAPRTGANVARGEATEAVVNLALPAGVTGDLMIEADSMQPFTKQALSVPATGSPPTHVEAFLTPVAGAEGITLLVKTLDRQPVANVRVDAFTITDATRDIAWQLGQPLWARRTAAADGRYQLPPLPPGEYGILLIATDSDGLVLPLAPFRRTFVLSGSSGFLEDIPLEPACALQVELLEGSGQPFDPLVHGNVTISLNPIGQTGLQRKWTAWQKPGPDGKATATVSEANKVPGTGVIWVDEPVTPGTYLLEVVVNGDPRVSQTLVLRNNERQVEQVYVR